MFLVLLKFSKNKQQAPAYMAEHNAWLTQGFDNGHLQMAGSLKPGLGGCVLSLLSDRDEVVAYVEQDPFVQQDVVTYELLDIEPSRLAEPLAYWQAEA